ncbi:uncharacterized protein DNG_09901 [Cephalotrichum gorgonifer]|uniref:BZIP domain-containing protein n=1 Tax=Cephalotrichum gorgonifer TaxID=2041049 RepID=A0AAE8N6Q6_9PEZI|nr:uncharacterized protein DNG_09901 [Cephalotrichum gorgonifer]
MPRLSEAHGPEEDWTGLRDAKARRKLQNRLNVRAHRRRKALESESLVRSSVVTSRGESLGAATLPGHDPSLHVMSRKPIRDAAAAELSNQLAPLLTKTKTSLPPPRQRVLFSCLDEERCGCGDYSDIITSSFPLSLDHLIPLVQYNLVRASLTNAFILSIHVPGNMCAKVWERMPRFPAPPTVPDSLAPTPLQLSVPHDVWIDLLPDRTLRDNTLRALGVIDLCALQRDLTGYMCGGNDNPEFMGILVWSDPWCADGWELSEGFVRKWSILLQGCWELIAATNRWRAKRGEEPLAIEL